MDYKGQSQGELLVSLVPMSRTVVLEDLEDLSEMQGQTLDLQVSLQSARGLPQRIVAQSKSLYIAFNFFAQSEPIRSPRVALTSINPKIDYTGLLSEIVTPEFVEFTSSAALVFEVWASVEDPGDWPDPSTAPTPNTSADDTTSNGHENDGGRSRGGGGGGGGRGGGGGDSEEVLALREENRALKVLLEKAYAEIDELRSLAPSVRNKLDAARSMDSDMNGTAMR